MSSQQSSRNHSAYSSTSSSYHAHVYASQATQASYNTNTWMTVIPIEDDDLTFGGKPLSDWYEEDRRRYSSESFEVPPEQQEARGRTRQRAYEPAPSSGHHHHHNNKHGHKKHHHAKKSDNK